MKQIKYIMLSFLLVTLISACEEDKVEFSSNSLFTALQAQKFDYTSKIGVGKIYQAQYSEDKKTINLDITYFPDETAPTYQDWQLQATVFHGAKVSPAIGGIKDLSEPIDFTITAPDGSTSQVTLITKIYEVPYGEIEHGFGRYNKLFEKTGDELGGWSTNAQTSMAVVGNDLIVNHYNNGAFLVYDKKTGLKIDKNVVMPTFGERLLAIANDDDDKMIAVSFGDASNKITPIRIYYWKNGIDQAPETFYELSTTIVNRTSSTAIGANIGVCGSMSGKAQIMLAMDGRGSAYNGVVRISVVNGAVSETECFEAPLGCVWSGLAVPASTTGKIPYFNVSGNQRGFIYVGKTGSYSFELAADKSNFLNKILASGAKYFEFNNAGYIAVSTVSWPGVVRLLIFNVDDPTLIPTPNTDVEKYAILNPLSESTINNLTYANDNGSGNVAVQIAEDGKTAYVYVLETNKGIMGYELTNIGSSSK
ncbi:DUF5018 domain-containing protein [Parabacteroides sp. Marseille-P3160]|uniref:DUF5018 domain-containing protein n=1 Tax=Parabacteroides sp. Marseille-P3160 TaxID=1917887 RepID=UPI0009BC173C|nr:DUF5018 domain-containing protein [Parabacteroides sp. Marseille-P3160]